MAPPSGLRCDRGVSMGAWMLALVLSAPVPARGNAAACSDDCHAVLTTCIKTSCADLRGRSARACRRRCHGTVGCTRVSTLAYVLSECRSDASGTAIRQALMVRQGNCPPIVVMELPFGPPVHEPFGLCRIWGSLRNGNTSVLAGGFHRLAVSPDGTDIVFEVSGKQALFPLATVPPELSGIYHVRADGVGLRRLAPASRVSTYVTYPDPRIVGLELGGCFIWDADEDIATGKLLLYTSCDPLGTGFFGGQIFAIGPGGGGLRQLTNARGLVREVDSSITVEMPGPWALAERR